MKIMVSKERKPSSVGDAGQPAEADPRSERISRRFEVPMLVVALLALPTMIVQGSTLGGVWQEAATVLDWLIWAAFAFELVVMLAVVPDRKRWLREHPLEVIIVALTPPFLPAPLQAARLLRLLRLARLFVAMGKARRVFSTEVLRYAALGTMIVVIGGGTALAAVEPDQRLSDWDGVWWAIETVTTVGYGDIYPKTTAGRIIGIVVMFSGVGFVALLTGTLAQRFVQGGEASKENETPRANPELIGKLEEVSGRLEDLSREVSDLRKAVYRKDLETRKRE